MENLQDKKGQGIVKPYLGFIDTNVLFKKPISCLFAIISLLTPIYVLSQFLQFEIYKSENARIIIASILILIVFAFAGIFGALIWWHRRIIRDEGPKMYNNFRRFIQTMGEWLGTFIAISVFCSILILLLFLKNEYYWLTSALPLPIPGIDLASALYGPVLGFIIIIATKIFLFLLDPLIWLIRQIWKLIVRVVLYVYRCIISFSGTVEKNIPFRVGATWLLSFAAIITTLYLCFKWQGIAPVIALAVSFGFMGYLMFKRKYFDE